MKKFRALLVLVALGALGMAASALAQSGRSAHPALATAHVASGTVVTTKKTSFGWILVTGSGKTLYLDVHDKVGHPACKGGCLSIWPPLKASGTVKASGRAKAVDLGTIKITGGIKQVTYNKHPLYTFATGKGTSGEGVNGFFLVSSTGSKVTKPTTTTTGTTTTSTGYGY